MGALRTSWGAHEPNPCPIETATASLQGATAWESLRAIVPPYLEYDPPSAAVAKTWLGLRETAHGERIDLTQFTFKSERHTGSFGRVHVVKLEPLAAAEFAVKEVDLRKTDWWTLPRGSPGPSPSYGLARKYMHSDIDDDKARRALLEWQVLRDARHPLVLTAYDAALSPCGGKLRLILECAREDLNDLLSRVKGFRLPEHSARFIAAELVVALDHIHGRGFVWRDLKLENILIQKSGHIALSDFDLADYWPPQPPDLVPPCTTKRMFGTIEYAAPEVIEGGQHTPAADWWAFGVLLYELLFGKQPYASWSQERTVHNIKHAALQLPADPLVSDDARSLISSLLRRAAAEGRAGTHDSTKRLGVKEIKRHPFFAGIDWANVWTADAEGYYRNLEPAPRNRHKAESPGVGTLQQKPWGKPA